MDKIDHGGLLPLGFCPECLDRMAKGAPYGRIKLPQGPSIVHAFCEHRQVGASLTLREGLPLRWNMLSPIDVLEWRELLKTKTETLAAFIEAHDTAALATAQAPIAKELIN
jgi:hypothetical protein